MRLILILLFLPNLANGSELNGDGWFPITFKGITPTIYQRLQNHWIIKVKASSSAMVLPFAKKRSIRRIRFKWKTQGNFKVHSSAQERSKEGDDAKIRIGLILSGKAPMIPFFAPRWIRELENRLKYSSDKMIYITPDLYTPPGSQFESPYSSSIHTLSVPSTNGIVDMTFQKAKTCVGLWIMADGDDTESHFVTHLRDLEVN